MTRAITSVLIATVIGVLLICPAAAQTDSEDTTPTPKEKLEELKTFLNQKAEQRPKFNPPDLGKRPLKEALANIDWPDVDRRLKKTEDDDKKFTLPFLKKPSGLRTAEDKDLPRLKKPEIKKVIIPILIPDTERVRATVEVFGQKTTYSAIAQAADGVDLRISGSAKKLILPERATVRDKLKTLKEQGPKLPEFGDKYMIVRSESSTDLSFSRFGVGYVISIMCDDPETDKRCAEDDFIISLADNMVVANRDVDVTAPSEQEPVEETQAEQETQTEQKAPAPASEPTRETVPDVLTDEAGSAFSYLPVGELLPDSGPGFVDDTVYRPDILFPTEDAAFLNSQVYRYGGYYGPQNGMEGGQCEPENYQYPWQDTFCEKRSRSQDLCPGGGHEGLDIRPATCEKDVHWAVAVEDARVIDLRRHWVTLQTADGTIYNYLHLNMAALEVVLGEDVKKGDRIGRISNDFYKSDGSSVPTTIHLHFEMYENYAASENEDPLFTKVNPYTTLISAYDRRLRQL